MTSLACGHPICVLVVVLLTGRNGTEFGVSRTVPNPEAFVPIPKVRDNMGGY
jgi:hypothetical protein